MKNIITICLIILLISICLMFTGCNSKNDSEFVQKTFELVVNQTETFSDPDITGIRIKITYNGMNTEKTFSVSGFGYSAVNTYYPATLKEFNWHGYQLRIDAVNPEKLIITLIGYNKN